MIAILYLVGFAILCSAFMVVAELRGWFNLDARDLKKQLDTAIAERDAAVAQREELLDMWVTDSKRSDHYLAILGATIIRHGGQIKLADHETHRRYQLRISKPDADGRVTYRAEVTGTGAKR